MSRYLTVTYYKKANGQTDEAMAVTKFLRNRDIQEASIILDFKDLKVLKSSIGGAVVPRDWNTISSYYYKVYTAIVTRLFEENGHQVPEELLKSAEESTQEEDGTEAEIRDIPTETIVEETVVE